MSWMDTPLISLLGRALQLTSARQALVSQNVANVDTPGYHTQDIDFSHELRRAMVDAADGNPPAMIHQVSGLVERPDGNNVNVDRESLLMAQNQLTFQLAVQLLRTEFNRQQLAISGGGSQ